MSRFCSALHARSRSSTCSPASPRPRPSGAIARPNFTQDIAVEIDAGRHPVVEAQIEQSSTNGVRLSPARQLCSSPGPHAGPPTCAESRSSAQAHVGSSFRQVGAYRAIDQSSRASAPPTTSPAASDLHGRDDRIANYPAQRQRRGAHGRGGRGTSTFDGLALAWRSRGRSGEKPGATLFATHYFRDDAVALGIDSGQRAPRCGRYKDTIVFLHAVEEGPASQS